MTFRFLSLLLLFSRISLFSRILSAFAYVFILYCNVCAWHGLNKGILLISALNVTYPLPSLCCSPWDIVWLRQCMQLLKNVCTCTYIGVSCIFFSWFACGRTVTWLSNMWTESLSFNGHNVTTTALSINLTILTASDRYKHKNTKNTGCAIGLPML